MRRVVVVSFVLGLGVSHAATARAQSADWKLAGRHLVVSAERAASVLFWRTRDLEIQGPRAEAHGFDASVLVPRGAASTSGVARFAADYVFPVGLSLGGDAGIGYSKAGHPSKPGALPHYRAWVFGVRAGYLVPLSPRVGVWPRVGVSGASHSASEAGDDNPLIVSTVTTWDLTIDPQLAVVLAPRIVFMSGLLLDIGIAGKQSWDDEAGSQQRAYRSSAYGVSAGLAVMF